MRLLDRIRDRGTAQTVEQSPISHPHPRILHLLDGGATLCGSERRTIEMGRGEFFKIEVCVVCVDLARREGIDTTIHPMNMPSLRRPLP